MIHVLAFLLLPAAQQPVGAVLDRCNAFLRSASSMSVHVEAGTDSLPTVGKGTLIYRRPNLVRFEMSWGLDRYLYACAAKSGLEVDFGSHSYYEFNPTPVFSPPPARVSEMPKVAFPQVLFARDVRTFIPSGPTLVGSETVDGSPADHVRAISSTAAGKIQVDLWVRADGSPAKYEVDMRAPTGHRNYRLSMSGYVVNHPEKDAAFSAAPERGFVPCGFAEVPDPIQPGSAMPLTGWVDLATGKPAELGASRSGMTLYVVAAPDCIPSKAAVHDLGLHPTVAKVVVLSTSADPHQPRAWGKTKACFDPSGASLAKIKACGTPLFILVNDKGTVTGLWFGFDTAQADALRKDIETAARS